MPAASPDMPAPIMATSYWESFIRLAWRTPCRRRELRSGLGGELRGQILGAAFQRRELAVIGLRHLDAMALAELHDDVEKVHGIELELVAQADLGLDRAQILVRGDVGNDVDN